MISRMLPPRRIALLACVTFVFGPIDVFAASTDITAIYAATGNGYQRQRGPDGNFLPETYTFGDGGRADGTYVDNSIDPLTFLKVAREVAEPLRRQNFVPAASAKDTKLLILLFWGTTIGAEGGQFSQNTPYLASAVNTVQSLGLGGQGVHSLAQGAPWPTGDEAAMVGQAATDELSMMIATNAMFNRMRDQNNARNAAILGFYEEWVKSQQLRGFLISDTILEELEADRYFVVLKAYDFQTLWKEKKKILLWETRFSVRSRGNRFDRMLPTMTLSASKYFGQNSGRLLREVVPVGRVEVGEATVIETKK